jgi:hypothetical protein
VGDKKSIFDPMGVGHGGQETGQEKVICGVPFRPANVQNTHRFPGSLKNRKINLMTIKCIPIIALRRCLPGAVPEPFSFSPLPGF